MVSESVVILVICVLMCGAFFRSKYFKSILSLLPIAVIPAVYLFARGVLFLLRKRIPPHYMQLTLAFILVLAVISTCVFFVLLGSRVSHKAARRVYLGVMIVYSLVIGWVYIFDSMAPLLA